jgi:hypothetical protein
MADPLSVAASIVGVAVPALHGTRLLLDDLQSIIDAPQSVESLKEDLRSVDMALQSLQAIGDPEWKSLGGTVANQSKVAISTCKRVCDKFRADLQHWTRHSGEGQLSWQDRANVGFFKQRRIKSTSEQLQNCKLTLNSVVSIATLYVYLRCRTQWGAHYYGVDIVRSTIPKLRKRSRRLCQRSRQRSPELFRRLTDN